MPISEREAWAAVLAAADRIEARLQTMTATIEQLAPHAARDRKVSAERAELRTALSEIRQWARVLGAQVEAGLHANPPLAVYALANPPRRDAGRYALMSREVVEIRYRHVQDRRYYKHAFGPRVALEANVADGSLRIRGLDGQPLSEDFPD